MMELAVHLLLGDLSLSNTVYILDSNDMNRARTTVHNWVHKAYLEPRTGRAADHIVLDETVVKVNGERFWLVGAIDTDANVILHVRLYPSRKTVACSNWACTSATKPSMNGTLSNVSSKR